MSEAQIPTTWNKALTAQALGVSLPTAERYIRTEGLPVMGSGSYGKGYQIIPAIAVHWALGRNAAADLKLQVTGWQLLAVGVAVAVERFRRMGDDQGELTAFIGRIYAELKKCGQIGRDDFFLEVGRWVAVMQQNPEGVPADGH